MCFVGECDNFELYLVLVVKWKEEQVAKSLTSRRTTANRQDHMSKAVVAC